MNLSIKKEQSGHKQKLTGNLKRSNVIIAYVEHEAIKVHQLIQEISIFKINDHLFFNKDRSYDFLFVFMVYAFLQICQKKFGPQIQLCVQLFEDMDRKSRERGRSLPALKRKTGSRKNEYEFEKLREREQQLGSTSEQPTYEEQFQLKLDNLKANVRSEEFKTQFVQEECKQLKKFYINVRGNFRYTIEAQQELIYAQKELKEAKKKFQLAYQKYQDSTGPSDPNYEKTEKMLDKSKQLYDACFQTVKRLKARLKTLNEEAKRVDTPSLVQLQEELQRIEGFKDFHVNIEKAIQRRAQLLAQLEALRQQRRQLQDHHKRILENLRNAEEQKLPEERIDEWRTAAKGLEEKSEGLRQAIKMTKEAFRNLC